MPHFAHFHLRGGKEAAVNQAKIHTSVDLGFFFFLRELDYP